MKYRKKPVVVEAIQYKFSSTLNFDDCYSNINDIKKFTNGSIKLKNALVIIPTLEGEMLVSGGDYIIKGVNGEFYPCKPDIFHKTYEKLKE